MEASFTFHGSVLILVTLVEVEVFCYQLSIYLTTYVSALSTLHITTYYCNCNCYLLVLPMYFEVSLQLCISYTAACNPGDACNFNFHSLCFSILLLVLYYRHHYYYHHHHLYHSLPVFDFPGSMLLTPQRVSIQFNSIVFGG